MLAMSHPRFLTTLLEFPSFPVLAIPAISCDDNSALTPQQGEATNLASTWVLKLLLKYVGDSKKEFQQGLGPSHLTPDDTSPRNAGALGPLAVSGGKAKDLGWPIRLLELLLSV